MWDMSEDQVSTITRLGGPSGTSFVDTLGPLKFDKNGNSFIIVIIDNFSKLVGLYPAKNTTSKDYLGALLQYLGYLRRSEATVDLSLHRS